MKLPFFLCPLLLAVSSLAPAQDKPAKAAVIAEPATLPERNPPIRFRKNIPTTWLSLTIGEGKNRQVRKMTAAIGFPTLRLIRSAIGNVHIGSLNPGDYRTLQPEEVNQLLQKFR